MLNIFSTFELKAITRPYIDVFCHITYPYSPLISKLLFELNPFPSLIRVLNHDDFIVVANAIASIENIFIGESIDSEFTSPHPYYENLS